MKLRGCERLAAVGTGRSAFRPKTGDVRLSAGFARNRRGPKASGCRRELDRPRTAISFSAARRASPWCALICYFQGISRGATISSAAASRGFGLQSPGFRRKCRAVEDAIAATYRSTCSLQPAACSLQPAACNHLGLRAKPALWGLGPEQELPYRSGRRSIPAGFVARRRNTSSIPPPRASPAGRLDGHLGTLILGFALRAKRGESSFPSPFGALAARSPRRFRTHLGGEAPSSGYAKSTLIPARVLTACAPAPQPEGSRPEPPAS